MICSVLIPSRKRPDRLKKTIESVFSTAHDVEIIVRADTDDLDTIKFLTENPHERLRWIAGDRKHGWFSICDFYQEMAELAHGDWIFVMNDDCTVEGRGWDELLREVPIGGFMAYPEFHILGGSTYINDAGGAFPIVPNKCWEWYGRQTIPEIVDTGLFDLLVNQNQWRVKFIKGMIGNHQRDNDEELAKHRL